MQWRRLQTDVYAHHNNVVDLFTYLHIWIFYALPRLSIVCESANYLYWLAPVSPPFHHTHYLFNRSRFDYENIKLLTFWNILIQMTCQIEPTNMVRSFACRSKYRFLWVLQYRRKRIFSTMFTITTRNIIPNCKVTNRIYQVLELNKIMQRVLPKWHRL